jgi:hypothetical protein
MKQSIRKYIFKDEMKLEPELISWKEYFLSLLGDLITVYKYIIRRETFVNIIFSLLIFFAYYHVFHIKGINLNWGIISGIITFPIVFAIASSFTRREQAIDAITKIKTHLYNITHNIYMFG